MTAHGTHPISPWPGLHGVMAEFATPTELVEATEKARLAGYVEMDGYSPFPIEEMDHALGIKKTKLPLLILAGGLTGCLGGFGMQWYANTVHYPLNLGGRPSNSWPMFIPITFELTILFASFCAVFGMLLANGFPHHYHPVFNVPSFDRASSESFFLCIEATDPKFDRDETTRFLKSLNPIEVTEVAE